MLVIGLTGGIGMGKSAAADALRAARHPRVRRRCRACTASMKGRRSIPIEAAFPGATREGKVDRTLLSRAIAGSPERLKRLEEIVHPMVVAAEIDFLIEQEKAGAKLAVLEIPLLFETGADARVDVTVAVSAPPNCSGTRAWRGPA